MLKYGFRNNNKNITQIRVTENLRIMLINMPKIIAIHPCTKYIQKH